MKVLVISFFTLLIGMSGALAQELPLIDPKNELPEALNDEETAKLIKAVDRGLKALHGGQKKDGSFPSHNYGQPAVTSLAIMAFLSRGHLPGEGPYGETLEKAINYVLAMQKKSGIFASRDIDSGGGGHSSNAPTYTHAISMLMLGEVYGLTDQQESFRIRSAIEKGLKFTIRLWDIQKKSPADDGGFRYTGPNRGARSDLSVTGWHATSLRSIRNAGFDVPQSVMDRISGYITRSQNPDGGFGYTSSGSGSTFAMTAAGTLCLALGGKVSSAETQKAAVYLSRFRVNNGGGLGRWPYYTCYYLTQASIQLGGQLWVRCMRECAAYLIAQQQADGLWPRRGSAAAYGSAYSTSMAIISLTPTLQILPIYQR